MHGDGFEATWQRRNRTANDRGNARRALDVAEASALDAEMEPVDATGRRATQ